MSPRPDHQPTLPDLHICPQCEGRLVYPVDWSEHDAVLWQVALRCPDCEWGSIDVYAQELVDRFDAELDRGTEALVRDLRDLTRANMEEAADRLGGALRAGALLPEDF